MISQRKKIILCLSSALFLSAAALCACGNKAQTGTASGSKKTVQTVQKAPEQGINSNYYIYRSTGNVFNINYPKTWKAEEDSETSVTFTAPGSGSGSYGEKVNVTAEDLKGKIDDLSMVKLTKLNAASKTIEGYNQEDFDDVIINNVQGEMVIYSGKQGGFNLKWYQVFIIGNERIYTITYSTEADKFDSRLETTEAMINTFKLK